MNITFENKTLYLPIVEAKDIQEGKTVPLLFEVEEPFIHNFTPLTKFDLKYSEPQYPSVLMQNEKSVLSEKHELNCAAVQTDQYDRTISYQLAIFWHFAGDGTHHSEHVKTPFGFYPGLSFFIENKYNVKSTAAFIKTIRLTRVNQEKWFWLIEIEKL